MKHTIWRLSLAIIFSMSASAWAGTIYKCKNSSGVTLYQEKPCEKEEQAVSSWASRSGAAVEEDTTFSGENKVLILGQGPGGHYYIDGSVNDNFLNFVVDTGATFVALPLSVAANAGIKCKKLLMMGTANGPSQACSATIEKLKIGNFTLRYVDAVVQPNLSQPLLGMNVLKQFRVEQDNGQMRLSRKY